MKHIAVIMDGNGRWATEKGLPRLSGHVAAKDAVLQLIEAADELKISVISLYAFSEDNFKRDNSEILGIFGIISDFLITTLIPMANARNYKLMFIGNLSKVPSDLLVNISKANQKTINNSGMKIIIAIAYSGREEIVRAFNLMLEQKLINADYSPVFGEDVEKYLYTATVPDPDAIVRYGGYMRLSDFMPYQGCYSELFFLDKFFPDASKHDIYEIVKNFKKIQRNFGDIKK